MLVVKNLSKIFNTASGDLKAIDNVNMTIQTGEFASVIGKSGSGKSTLLSMLGALDTPSDGTIEVDGVNIAKLSASKQTNYRAKEIGFVFQQYNLIPNLSALENVMLSLEFGGIPQKMRRSKAEKLLDEVGIEGDEQLRKPAKLSGGQQQRVAIARAIANKPAIILADEPTGNLDSQNGKKIFDLLHSLSRKEKTTIIAVTHDLDIAGKTDKTFKLVDGKIVN